MSGKTSLLEEAKARAAAAKAAKTRTSENPFAAQNVNQPPPAPANTYQAAPAPVAAPVRVAVPAPRAYQQAAPQQYTAPVPAPAPQSSAPAHAPSTFAQAPASAPAPVLSAKDAASQARDNWKQNESKMNVASTSKTVAGGGTVAPRWVPNKEKSNCSECNCTFDWVKRRHHCRRCGDVFCGDCSEQKALLPPNTAAKDSDTKNPRRVCRKCFEAVENIQVRRTCPSACPPAQVLAHVPKCMPTCL